MTTREELDEKWLAPVEPRILGITVRHAITEEEIDTFPTPPGVHTVTLTTEEFTAVCPVTGQPDWYTVEVRVYTPLRCIESKAWKLYLWGFRDKGVFCEDLASVIAHTAATATVGSAHAKVTQRPRGGISIVACADAEGITP